MTSWACFLVPTNSTDRPGGDGVDQEVVGALERAHRLLQVDDVDAVARAEDERFIFGFQRLVWWPKWTPASIISRMVMGRRRGRAASCLRRARLDGARRRGRGRCSFHVFLSRCCPPPASSGPKPAARSRGRHARPPRSGVWCWKGSGFYHIGGAFPAKPVAESSCQPRDFCGLGLCRLAPSSSSGMTVADRSSVRYRRSPHDRHITRKARRHQARHRQARHPAARDGRGRHHVHRGRRGDPPRARQADRLADPDGHHPARQAHRQRARRSSRTSSRSPSSTTSCSAAGTSSPTTPTRPPARPGVLSKEHLDAAQGLPDSASSR